MYYILINLPLLVVRCDVTVLVHVVIYPIILIINWRENTWCLSLIIIRTEEHAIRDVGLAV